ncbi:MAG: hypothetical protein WDZ94_01290 [Patescibacteria group bacterium]
MPAKPSSSARPRPGGGFNPGMGFGSEHLDEQAMQQAVSQKALSQQGASASTTASAAQNVPTNLNDLSGSSEAEQNESASEDIVDGILIKPVEQVVKDVGQAIGLPEWLQWLGVTTETPEEAEKKKVVWQRYQALDQEQQAYAKQRFEAEMQKRQQDEEEQQQRAAAEATEQQFAVPQGKKDGAEGLGSKSKKQQASHMVQQQRQSFNSTMSAN